MNEELKVIGAIVRLEVLEEVVTEPRKSGVPRMNIVHVRAVGTGADPTHPKWALELGTTYTEKARIEFVCPADRVDELACLICQHARTGQRGDGVVFASRVDEVIKIRTGVRGLEALA
ncbi:MAG: P-II family nitrogen regulator [Gemmatimonadetes bacterium]|nr:P-II family nitrogen regulator [Gemmatimonadota bacterium]